MDFVAQVSLADPIAFSETFAMAYVFMCSETKCGTYDPTSGANCVLLQTFTDDPFVATRNKQPMFGAYPDYVIESSVAIEPDIQTADFRGDWSIREQVHSRTKIGGVPFWFQANDWPDCHYCGGKTRFIAQFNAEVDGPRPVGAYDDEDHYILNFGDVGTGYLFLCADTCCDVGAAFLWQS